MKKLKTFHPFHSIVFKDTDTQTGPLPDHESKSSLVAFSFRKEDKAKAPSSIEKIVRPQSKTILATASSHTKTERRVTITGLVRETVLVEDSGTTTVEPVATNVTEGSVITITEFEPSVAESFEF